MNDPMTEEQRKANRVASQTRYYQKNKAKINKLAVERRKTNPPKKNPERTNETKRKYYAKRKEQDPQFLAHCAMKQRERYAKSPKQRERERNKAREYRAKYPEKARQSVRNHHYRANYGITIEERDQLLESQGNRCRICRVELSKAIVDHCHKTKRVRGILCHHCNLILGHCRDNVAILTAAIAYLKGESIAINDTDPLGSD